MTASPAGVVPVGTAVTETVTVLDQDGNPVPNVDVFCFPKSGSGGDDDCHQHVGRPTLAVRPSTSFNREPEGDAFVRRSSTTGAAPVTKTDTVDLR